MQRPMAAVLRRYTQPPCCEAAGRDEQPVLTRRSRRSRRTRRRSRGGPGRRREAGLVRWELRVGACPPGRTGARGPRGSRSSVRVPRVLGLGAAPHPAVPGRTPAVQPLPPEAELLPELPGPAQPEHPEPGPGAGGLRAALPLQVPGGRLPSVPSPHGEARPRGRVRVPAVHVSVSRRDLQVARLAGGCHAAPDAGAQVHHHAAGGGHRLPGDRHQSPGRRGLGDDAVVFHSPLHARLGEAGEVRGPSAVLCRRAADWLPQAGRELCLPPGAQRQPPPAHLGGHTTLHPRGGGGRHLEQRLPGV